jgi:ATP/ADP translocase
MLPICFLRFPNLHLYCGLKVLIENLFFTSTFFIGGLVVASWLVCIHGWFAKEIISVINHFTTLHLFVLFVCVEEKDQQEMHKLTLHLLVLFVYMQNIFYSRNLKFSHYAYLFCFHLFVCIKFGRLKDQDLLSSK